MKKLHVTILEHHACAFEQWVEMIENAEETIDIATYAIRPGAAPGIILGLLREAADRGVRVRIIADGLLETALKRPLLGYLLAHKNFHIRLYRPFRWRFITTVHHRFHEKVFVVDGKRFITGGRNIRDRYFSNHRTGNERLTFDRELFVEAEEHHPLITHIVEHYNSVWESSDAWHPLPLSKPALVEKGHDAVARELEAFRKGTSPLSLNTCPQKEKPTALSDLTFLHDTRLEKSEQTGTTKAIYDACAKAEKSIYIQSPFVLSTPAMRSVFEDALSRGVEINILTNSCASTDNVIASNAYRRYRQELISLGVRLWEYQGHHNLHQKTCIIDDATCILGSYNFDILSAQSNLESVYITTSTALARKLKTYMDSYKDESLERGKDDQLVPRESVTPARISLEKRFLGFFLYVLAPVYKRFV